MEEDPCAERKGELACRECDMRELQVEANAAERIGISSCSDGNEVPRRVSE